MLPLLFLGLLAHACLVRPQELQPKNIFILAGQSNMAGRGGVNNTWDRIVPPQCQPNPSILRLNANLTWVLAQEPLHVDIDTNMTTGVGPGMAFANVVLAKDPTFGVIGLVPCAIGGTAISQWGRGTSLYKRLVRRAQAALQDGGTIQALLWYQGEADTVSKEAADSYGAKLESFFVDVREDLKSPMLPIIQVALASGSVPFVDTVREVQLGIDLLELRTVDAKGLPLESDGIHLTTQAQVQLGERMADTFLQLLPSTNGPILSPIPSSAPRRAIGYVTWICRVIIMHLNYLT